MNSVILCDEHGTPSGIADIFEAHRDEGMLHLAFSIFVFRNDRSELLLQKRSDKKMLWPGYWANTCCSHPREGEPLLERAAERLQEECGFTCPLEEGPSFVYRAEDPNGNGVEYEYDTILTADTDEDIALDPNPDEVSEMQWMNVDDLRKDFEENPERYTPWLVKGLEMLVAGS